MVKPAMLCGLETVALRNRQEAELEVAEVKMLRLSLGVTRLIGSGMKTSRGTTHLRYFGEKVRETRLR